MDDAKGAAAKTKYVATIDATIVRGAMMASERAAATAKLGDAVCSDVGGVNPMRLRFDIHAVPGAKTPQYDATIVVVETQGDQPERMTAVPRLTVAPGQDVRLIVGGQDGERLEILVRIDER